MFEYLTPFRVILVTGPQRSGTTIAAKMIAQDTGKEFVREDFPQFANIEDNLIRLANYGQNLVIQCPAWCHMIHQLGSMGGVAIVFMLRRTSEIIRSQERIEWEWEPVELAKYGYTNMHEFRNWRGFRKLGGGPLVDLGSHQIDVFSWFLGCNPTSVMASGGLDYYKGGQWKPRDWYDNVMAVYEYATPAGTVRAYYQVLTTTSARGYFETFMGDAGTMQISEDPGKIRVYAEGHINAPEAWKKWEDKGYVMRIKDDGRAAATKDPKDAIIEVYKSVPATAYLMPVAFAQSYHQPHLQNFFDAVRGKAKLNCPPEVGYETAVIVLKANDAVAAARRLDFKAKDFKA